MNKSESYQNWALEELMNYVKSVAEIETDISYDDAPEQNKPVNNEDYKNWALEELMNYVKSIAEIETDIPYKNLQRQTFPLQNKLIEVEVTAIATETPQQINGEIVFEENEEIALSPSNLTNPMVLVQDLHLSNGNLVKRVTYLSQAIAEFHQDLELYKAQFHAASSKLSKRNQELEASNKTMKEQQSSIEELKTELAIAKKLVAEVQADYNEQFEQLSAEKENCRDLRTRLNREQQHSLQLKVALGKCLEVPAVSYQLANDEGGSTANNLEDSSSFAAKAPPIEPWTTQTRGGSTQIDLAWERQHFPSQNDANNNFSPIASPEPLELFNSLTEDEVTDAIAPTDIEQENLEDAIAPTDIDEVQAVSPVATQVNVRAKSPSPLVYPSRPPKGRKSLAAIELPSFIS